MLENQVNDQILLLGGDLTKDILFPLNYPFYNIPEHQELYKLLNSLSPLAVIFISHSPVDPVPISQDKDFKIPSATISSESGEKIINSDGNVISIKIESTITEAKSSILFGGLKSNRLPEIILIAHLDTQFFSPGAHDDASGVLCLLEIMRLLKENDSSLPIKFVITTGHEHTGDGEKLFIDKVNDAGIILKYFFNIDGIGHKRIEDQISFYNMEEQLKTKILNLQEDYEIIEGSQWFQGLHAVFAQTGTTCLALSSQSLGIHHTPKDRFDLLSLSKIKNRAEFIYKILKIIEIELSY
ncbi:MAG: M28 family peptidase [Promethearchaeota archaeon]|jgi:Zn-dependent M28 family amino/carboxypeptidase